MIEFKTQKKELFNTIQSELDIMQKFIDVHLNDNDSFIKSNDEPYSLPNLVKSLGIIEYSIFKLDDNHLSLRIIGKESSINHLIKLVNEYMQTLDEIKEADNRLIEIKKMNLEIK